MTPHNQDNDHKSPKHHNTTTLQHYKYLVKLIISTNLMA